jgi:hypothetical protein
VFETCRRHHKNISLTKVYFIGVYYMILQCTVQKNIKLIQLFINVSNILKDKTAVSIYKCQDDSRRQTGP